MLKINPYIFVKKPQFIDLTRLKSYLNNYMKKEFGGACLTF